MDDDGAFGLAMVLAGLAGWVDAAGLGSSGGVFLSFMSGNTTDLAASVVHRDWARVGTIAAIVVLFVGGVAIGEIIEPRGGQRGHALVLGCEAMALALGAALHWPGAGSPTFVSLFPLVFAMGLQNATMHQPGGVSIGLTYVTGTLVQVGRALAGQHDRRQMAKYLALWLSLAIGAGLGALMLSVSMFAALLAATMAAGLLAATAAFGRR